MHASSSQLRWVGIAAACGLAGIVLELTGVPFGALLRSAVTATPERAREPQPTAANGSVRGPDEPGGPGDDRTGFHPAGPPAILTGRARVRQELRRARRQARRRAGEGFGFVTDVDGNLAPYEVVERGERYETATAVDAADLAKKLSGSRGGVSFWLQPQWQAGNQDDADFLAIADGQLRLQKNVDFLRFELADNNGMTYSLGIPITAWTTGEWHQVAAFWDGSVFQLYIDGDFVRETAINGPFFLPRRPDMLVGSDFPENRPVASGTVGGLTVYRRPLSPYEVRRRFAANVG